jgi:hypothetical protein
MEAELLDRYVHEVGRRLPKKQRADVEAELHSLLMDALQDRMAEGGTEERAPEADQVAVLQEFGPPAQVAAQYAPPHRYLIGPRVYDLYRIVVAAVAGSITLAYLVLLLLAAWGDPEPFRALVSSFGEVFGSYLGAVLAGLGAVTLTFAILERVAPDLNFEVEGEAAWDPHTLPQIQDRDRIEVGGQIAAIVLTVIALIVFNFFPEWIGISFRGSINDAPRSWHTMPLLAPIFFTAYLPWLNVLWIANIGLSIVLLRQGRWQRLTRLADFVLTVLGAFILYRMAFGPALLAMGAIQPESLRDTLGAILPAMLKVALIIGLVASIGEAVHKLYLVFRTSSVPLFGRLDRRPSADR